MVGEKDTRFSAMYGWEAMMAVWRSVFFVFFPAYRRTLDVEDALAGPESAASASTPVQGVSGETDRNVFT